MIKLLFITFSVFYCLISFAQEKTIKGFVYDDYTNYRIKDVIVSPSLFKDTVFSNNKGKYTIVVPSKYRDILFFEHPDYYTHIDRVYAGDAMRIKSVSLIPKTFKLDTVCYLAYKENIWLKGLVKDRYSQKAVLNAKIRLENNKIISYSDIDGRFEVAIPKSNKNLIVNHPEFKTSLSEVKRNSRHDRYMEIWLDRKNPPSKDSIGRRMNNMILFAVNELFTGSIGLNYDRFIKFKHAVGINLSNYLFGFGHLPLFNQGISRFTGIKVAPYYSYYFMRSMRKGAFVQAKAIGGYFNVEELYYYYPVDSRYGEYRSVQFSSFGFGVGIGLYNILPKMKHGIFKLYVGFQYFPMHGIPETTESDRYGTLKVEDNWWYVNGPGSFVEIKISFGGIF